MGFVRLSEIGLTDPLHTRLTTGSSPSSRGSISRVFVNLTIPRERMPLWIGGERGPSRRTGRQTGRDEASQADHRWR